ncbi:MAG: pyruvate dehydrogenase (acetyl-transferring), homodimeric type [Gammaproteobacteria bacterium]|nr:pyruvate dehydrogenase (acetyl-transferring), homodimeric type [Gammaproteobacteria bacterium]
MTSPSTGSDLDPQETQEWLDSLQAVIEAEGPARAEFLLHELLNRAKLNGIDTPFSANTPYLNTIPVSQQVNIPGDQGMEWRIRSIIRWNAMAMVLKANKESSELGGHIASFASAATLYEVGFNHFFHAPTKTHGGDLLFIQGHSAPGIYARAFLEGRLDEKDLNNFRQDLAEGGGLSSYPHPWLMPEFWQFPTVSMGLASMMAIYQARFMKYLHQRGLIDQGNRQVWAFLGDGEMDEPESKGAIGLAAREKLGNLNFVINCNLQRLDGPVRGNDKIVQELEGIFRGAGWNVIKVLWGSEWDNLLLQDNSGILAKRMEEALDGEYQAYKAKGGAYTREHFFGKYPELAKLVEHMSDEEIYRMKRGGHDPRKVYAAYQAAVNYTDGPTVILAKTVKGYGMGIGSGEGQNITHQLKKMGLEALTKFRTRFNIPIDDSQLADAPFYKPPADSPEMKYLMQRREALGGSLPVRQTDSPALKIPTLESLSSFLEGTGEREISTTMAFVRILTALTKDKEIGPNIVPIVPDEARTFGMEGLFRQLGIYSPEGQKYTPVDSDQFMFYREDAKGQILEEGINEAGAFCSWIAAATAYSCHNTSMIPFYIYYSMFGFQRVGDFAWAAGDMRARGFLIGGTAGRTTLAGEGLQHQDGHSHLLASTIPNCISYDPAYLYELIVIIQSGLQRMYQAQENVYFYITVENENYSHPAMPKGAEKGILKGLYPLKPASRKKPKGPQVRLIGAGSILREVIAAAAILEEDFGVTAPVWSATSFNELRRDGLETDHWNLLHPQEKPKEAYVSQILSRSQGPVIAASDYMKSVADQIRPWVPGSYTVLGTDGFGRSDTRRRLRDFFEVDRRWITFAALKALADQGEIEPQRVTEAIARFGIDPEKPNPTTV